MSTPITPPPTSLALLPENVAVIRALLAHFEADGWEYDATQTWGPADADGNRPTWVTRRWTKDRQSKLVEWCPVDGLTAAWTNTDHFENVPVTSAQQVADLLHAVGMVPVQLSSGYKAAKAEPIERATAAGLGQVLDIDQMRRVDRALLALEAFYGHHEECDCPLDSEPTCGRDGLWQVAKTVIDALQLPTHTTTRKEGS